MKPPIIGETDILIIGAGFAGTSVASRVVGRDVLVIDRGEPMDVGRANAVAAADLPNRERRGRLHRLDYDPIAESEWLGVRSKLPYNNISLPLSGMCSNVYTYRQGGISNWWGGHVQRISEETFQKRGELCWPPIAKAVEPFIKAAAAAMHVHGDTTRSADLVVGPIDGADWWANRLNGLFPSAVMTPMARNTSLLSSSSFGQCVGRGWCTLCTEDAKARPQNTYPTVTVQHSTLVKSIEFEGRRAVAVEAEADDHEFRIGVNSVVIAAGGLENVALLRRSRLPQQTPVERIGAHFQDHCVCKIAARLPFTIPSRFGGTHADIEIPELSGYVNGIEVKVLLFNGIVPPDVSAQALLRGNTALWSLATAEEDSRRLATFLLQIEIPPEWKLSIRARGLNAYIKTMEYWKHIPDIDLVVLHVVKNLRARGIEVIDVDPNYRGSFFGCHYTGTTPMSDTDNSVLTTSQTLVGTDNVYINGGSALPRCGAAGPTLMINALGLRLGEALSNV